MPGKFPQRAGGSHGEVGGGRQRLHGLRGHGGRRDVVVLAFGPDQIGQTGDGIHHAVQQVMGGLGLPMG